MKWRPVGSSVPQCHCGVKTIPLMLKWKRWERAQWLSCVTARQMSISVCRCSKNTHSRPTAAAGVLVGEERALDNETWLGLEILVTSWFWLVTEDCLLRAPWKEVPLLKVLTTSICNGGKNETSCLRNGHNFATDRSCIL